MDSAFLSPSPAVPDDVCCPMDVDARRRRLLALAGGGAAGALLGAWAPAARAAWRAELFEARSPRDLARLLGAAAPQDGEAALQLLADDLADNGAAVRVTALSRLPGPQQMALMVERNPVPLAALFDIPAGTLPQITTQLKVAESSPLMLMARAGAQTVQASRLVRVTLGGCGNDGAPEEPSARAVQATRIRAQVQGERTQVRLLMSHPMESGQRKNAAGRLVAAHHIRELEVQHNGRTVLAAQWGPGVSRNPYLQFHFSGGRPGDRLRVAWSDSQGGTRSDESLIA